MTPEAEWQRIERVNRESARRGAGLRPLIQSNACTACRSYPCRCPILRREPCSCGGWIEAADNERSIIEAVGRHNDSAVHSLWAVKHGFRPEKEH